MKYILIFLIFAFFACKNEQQQPEEPGTARAMAFAAVSPAAKLDSITLTPSGDSILWYSEQRTGTYTYTVTNYQFRAKKKDSTVIPDPDPGPVQKFDIAYTPLLIGSTDVNRPNAGAEQWHDRNDVNLGYTPKAVYWRFVSTRIATATRGVYNWSFLDNLFEQAKAKKQKLSFGIMTVYPDGTPNEGLISIPAGGYASYPLWLQNAMMQESIKPWRTSNTWTPNYNSPTYQAWVLELNKAVNDHIYQKGYQDIVNTIDIRSYGAWGEWHSGYTPNNVVTDYPSGTFPTAASLKAIVDGYINGFPNFQLMAMIAGFDAGWLNNTKNPPEIAHYLLTKRNNKGLIGWRRDQWGALDSYLSSYLENNTRSYAGLIFKDSIMARYRQAPVMGEPPAWSPNAYSDLEKQIRLYGATSFGNGNYGTGITTEIANRVKASSKAAGYRIRPVSTTALVSRGSVTISTVWRNEGIAPAYDDWFVWYDITDESGKVYSHKSNFGFRLMLGQQTENTTITGLPAGRYRITLRVSDNYFGNMPLQISNSNSDNSVPLITNAAM